MDVSNLAAIGHSLKTVINFCVLFGITSSFEWLWTKRLELMKCILQLVARRQSSCRRYKILRYNTLSVIF